MGVEMLPRVILIVLQVLGAVYLVPWIKTSLSLTLPRVAGYDVDIFLWAVMFAVAVFVIGFVGSLILKGLRTPPSGALALSIILAFIFAGLTFVPQITQAVTSSGIGIATFWWPMIGALIGYFLRR